MKRLDLETMPFGNGGGSVKTLDDVIKACKAPMTEIEVGSITMQPRSGNIDETYYFHPQDLWSLNALGLPNFGREYYKKHLSEMVKHAHGTGKKLRANIAPFSPDECGQLADMCLYHGADSVVINGSCPNVWDDGKHSVIPALHPAGAETLVEATKRALGNLDQVWFKLSPTNDLDLALKLVEVFRTYGLNKLVCCNTKGGQQGVRVEGTPALAFRAGEGEQLRHEGGLAGRGSYNDSLSTVKTFAQHMPEADIIGLGGIFDGVDVESYLNAGCMGVQSTTGYLERGGKIFVDMLSHLTDRIAA